MATKYAQLGYGSSGSDVRKLQEQLNRNGYKLDVDGVFGNQTQSAVQDYQKKNNLAVDGIVGQETWGTIEKQQSDYTTNSESGKQQTGDSVADNVMEENNGGYQESDAVQQAYALLQEHMGNQPGAYQSAWADQINAILDQILNREKFSYDLNGDALYQQYKDMYTLHGQQAMMDTIGQAAALTGGYGNSYALTAGQQAYQGYLQQLNAVLPELYGIALDQYNQEGQAMLDQYALLAGQDENDYGRYRDEVSDYYGRLQQIYNQYNDERSYDYGKWADERDFNYGQERDKAADDKWQAEFDEDKRRYEQALELEYSRGKGSSGGSSGGGGGSSGGGGSNYDAEAANRQKELVDAGYDIAVDGIWGPESQAAWEDYQNGGRAEPTLSDAGQNFINNMPYAHAGSDINVWKQIVLERLNKAYNNGYLTEDDVAIIVARFGL